jgi:mycothiol synthase
MDASLGLTDPPPPFTARPATWDDVDAVTAVVAACERFHDGVVGVDREDVVADWQRASFDLATESAVVLDGDRIVAQVDVFQGRADANVHPDHHGRGIGTWLLGQGERIAGAQDVPRARQTISDHATDAAALLQRHGYGYLYTSWILRIEHTERPPEPELPAGVAFRAFVPGADDHEVYRVIEDAFGEWPDRPPTSFDDWYPMILGRESFEPWTVLLAADTSTGEIVGVANLLDQDPEAGWVQQLATKASHRHRGIARALMRRAMTESWDQGKPALEVSTDSRTGALGLYERVGMSVTFSYTTYAKDLPTHPVRG